MTDEILIKKENGGELLTPTMRRAKSVTQLISLELRKASKSARASRPISSGGAGFRERRADRFFKKVMLYSFGIIFLFPSVLGLFYYQLIASGQFVSEAKLAVKSGEASTGLSSLGGLSSLVDTGQSRDVLIIADFIKSQALVDELSKKFDLREMFRGSLTDPVARLGADSSQEKLLRYWKNQVDVSVDRSSGLLSLKVRAFSPSSSLDLANSIISISEKMVNSLTRRNELDSVTEAGRELARAKSALEESVAAQKDERNNAGILSEESAAAGFNDILTSLRLELSKKEQRLGTLVSLNAANSPERRVLNNEIGVLVNQINDYEERIAGSRATTAGGKVESVANRSVALKLSALNVEVSRNQYQNAVASYEAARLAAERQRSYLIAYVTPRMAQESLYPRRLLMSFAIVGFSFLIWAVFIGLSFVVRDNMVK